MKRIISLSKNLNLLPILVLMVATTILYTYSATEVHATTEPDDEVVSYLAHERDISIDEARKRIGWQEKAGALDDRLKEVLPKADYGSLWIDDSTDRVNIGLTEGSIDNVSNRQIILSEVQNAGISDGINIVSVKHSYQTLAQTSEAIYQLRKQYIEDNEWPIQMGLKIDLNKVQVDIPADEAHLTAGHQRVLSVIEDKYKNQVFFRPFSQRFQEAACNWWFCDSPLRGAVGIKGNSGSDIDCTAGPIVQGVSSGNLYILTAGHCASHGTSWSSETYNYTDKYIGNITSTLYNEQTPIDAMIISTTSTDFTSVAGTILKRSGEEWSSYPGYLDGPPSYDESYNLSTHASSTVGERVCISPAITGGWPSEPNGGTCGEVEELSVWVDGGDGKVTLTHRVGLCARQGDSGAPIFGPSNVAKGIFRGFEPGHSVCSHWNYFTPIATILNGFTSKGQSISIY